MSIITRDLIRNRMEFTRLISNHKYEIHPDGIVFPKMGLKVAGVFTTFINGQDMQVDTNVVTAEGINRILNTVFVAGAAAPAYIAPFLNNVTPGDSLTAATYNAVLNEWITYDEPNRVQWVLPGATANKLLSNAAAPAVFTASAGVAALSVQGAGILAGQPKQSTTAPVFVASKFATARVLSASDKLTIQYDFSGASA